MNLSFTMIILRSRTGLIHQSVHDSTSLLVSVVSSIHKPANVSQCRYNLWPTSLHSTGPASFTNTELPNWSRLQVLRICWPWQFKLGKNFDQFYRRVLIDWTFVVLSTSYLMHCLVIWLLFLFRPTFLFGTILEYGHQQRRATRSVTLKHHISWRLL